MNEDVNLRRVRMQPNNRCGRPARARQAKNRARTSFDSNAKAKDDKRCPPRGGAVYGVTSLTGRKVRRMYVSVETCGSVARFIEHSCTPNTLFMRCEGDDV